MAHLGARAFDEIGGEVVQTTAFVLGGHAVSGYHGSYVRAVEPTTQNAKQSLFLSGNHRFKIDQRNYSKILGAPIAYWASDAMRKMFERKSIREYCEVRAGISTGDNSSFIVLWHEVDFFKSRIASESDWLYTPHNKGGEYRKWYGNIEHFLKYSTSALKRMEKCAGFRHDGKEFYFQPHITWSKISSGKASFRYFNDGFTFDSAGLGLFFLDNSMNITILSLLNSKVIEALLSFLNPTLNVTPITISSLPYIDTNQKVECIAHDCIDISTFDWDSFETSWDFTRHPML